MTEGPPGWLGYIGYFSSQVYGDYFMRHVINQRLISRVRAFIIAQLDHISDTKKTLILSVLLVLFVL